FFPGCPYNNNSFVSEVYEVFQSERIKDDISFNRHLSAAFSGYLNQYLYHTFDPNDPNMKATVDAKSFYVAPRLGLTWQPTTETSIRFAAGSGIAPPDISSIRGINCPPQPNNPGSPTYYTQNLSSTNLKPETSFSFDLGGDFRVRHANAIFSADIYTTNLVHQVYSDTRLGGTFLGLPLYISQLRNLSRSRYEGFEYSVRSLNTVGLNWLVQ